MNSIIEILTIRSDVFSRTTGVFILAGVLLYACAT